MIRGLGRGLFGTLVGVVLGALAPSCSDPARTLTFSVPDGCQPLLVDEGDGAPSNGACLAPFPSDFYREADPASRTGWRVHLRGAARPVPTSTVEGLDLHDAVAVDGASTVASIAAGLRGHVVADGLPGVLDDPSSSARPDSATVIIEADSGTLIPHYSDVFDERDGSYTPIVIRAFSPLRPRTRYIVAIQGARTAAPPESALAPPGGGFRRLRDHDAASIPALASLTPHFENDIFPVLAHVGLDRGHLQLAWDFTTGSEEQPMADMLRVRELTLAWMATNPPDVSVVSTAEGVDTIANVVTLSVSAPLFLDTRQPGGRLTRDASGLVQQNGTTTFSMVAVVPRSVQDSSSPGLALAYGHGFFGSFRELTEGNGAHTIASTIGAILFGVEWWGMTEKDSGLVSDALSAHPDHVTDFTDRVHQAMANWLVATHVIRSSLPQVRAFHRPAPHEAELLYDASFVGFFGASEGHILGGTLAALNNDFSRIVLNVGGGGFTHIMPRSAAFGPFGALLSIAFPDPLVGPSFLCMLQGPLDHIDSTTYAKNVLTEPLSGAPADRRVLMQVGLGDAEVPNMGSFLHARALGIGQLVPAPSNVFGLAPVDANAPSSMTLFDFGLDRSLYAAPNPLPHNAVHEGVRIDKHALAQMKAFLRPDGHIIDACGGPCRAE